MSRVSPADSKTSTADRCIGDIRAYTVQKCVTKGDKVPAI